MRRPYLWLAVAVVAAGVVVSALGRSASDRAGRIAAPAAEAPVVDVALEIRAGTVAPDMVRLAKGTRVRLRVTNEGPGAAHVSLPGYEDRLSIPPLGAGAGWSGTFLADRPGEDFAWIVDGRPSGRLIVSGSHLVEGHR